MGRRTTAPRLHKAVIRYTQIVSRMLKFIEFFPELLNELSLYKVHMAVSPTPDNSPLHALFKGDIKQWQELQNKKNFERPYILSFIYYQLNEWFYAGVYRSKSSSYYEQDGHYEYDTELTEIGSNLIGRLVVNFNINFRASYLRLENHFDEFNVSELMKERLTILPCVLLQVGLDFRSIRHLFAIGQRFKAGRIRPVKSSDFNHHHKAKLYSDTGCHKIPDLQQY